MGALIILIAVLIDTCAHLLPGGAGVLQARRVSWVSSYSNKMIEWLARIKITNGYLMVLALFIPMCLAVALLQLLFTSVLSSLGKIIFLSLLLCYLLGNPDAEQYESKFVQMHESRFALLFWFAILGPLGALLYWFLIVSQNNISIHTNISSLHAIAAWIPARITGFVYGLVGKFNSVLKCWLTCMSNLTLPSSQVLVDCGHAAVDTAEPEDEARLVFRAYVAWTVLSMVIILFL